MPIKPENRARYPNNWQEIRTAILERANNCCEQCRVKNGSLIQRGFWKDRGTFRCEDGAVRNEDNGWWLGCAHESDYCGEWKRIVLTVAHLDHIPEHCDPSNLKALCQLHHLRYDAKHHAETARQTRHARKAIADLFEEQP